MKFEIKDKAIETLKRNIGANVFVVLLENHNILIKEGKLVSVSHQGISLVSKIANEGRLSYNYYKGKSKYILHIYNKLNIDFLKGKDAIPFAEKLKSGDFKVLIDSLKPFLKKEINIVYTQQPGLTYSNGKFADMGIKELIINPAPFYNTELRLSYNQIFHIYGRGDDDLIG